jgi:3-deoxy-D-manno-octulosonic-acid transferase
MQSEESAHRLLDLGADPARVTVTGSLKFDSLELPVLGHGKPRERVLRFFRVSANRPVVVAGSTFRGEEAAVLHAFSRIKATMPTALAVIAPRQPERFGEVERLAREPAFDRPAVGSADRRRAARRCGRADTLGELAQLYQIATAVFVGGSPLIHAGHTSSSPRCSA